MQEESSNSGTDLSQIDQQGYEESLKRDFNLWSVFALAIAFISPIVALYAIFGLAFAAGGPAFWWGFLVVLAGQFLVALVFAELVSRWPLEGSVYQWSGQLLGNSCGWFESAAFVGQVIQPNGGTTRSGA